MRRAIAVLCSCHAYRWKSHAHSGCGAARLADPVSAGRCPIQRGHTVGSTHPRNTFVRSFVLVTADLSLSTLMARFVSLELVATRIVHPYFAAQVQSLLTTICRGRPVWCCDMRQNHRLGSAQVTRCSCILSYRAVPPAPVMMRHRATDQRNTACLRTVQLITAFSDLFSPLLLVSSLLVL